jgi:hypothetical protein
MRRNRIVVDFVVRSGARRFLDEKILPTSEVVIRGSKYVVLLRWNARVLGISEVDHE